MYKQHFGKGKRMRFYSENEYYETLGFLSKTDSSTLIVWERNQDQGAWGPEGRILCFHSLNKFTPPLKRKFTKGLGKKIKHRINCTEFVANLINNHEFVLNEKQDIVKIKHTIPESFHADFDKGYYL